MDVVVRTLTCGECGSAYRFTENGRRRGPGSFECQVCGQTIFIWACDENTDYYFELVEREAWRDPPDTPVV